MQYGHYLQRHGRRYRFRARFPKALVHCRNLGELIVNLKTDSRRIAIQRARATRVAMETLVDELELVQERTEAERRVKVWVAQQSLRWETGIASSGHAFLTAQEADTLGQEDAEGLGDLLRLAASEYGRPRFKTSLSRILAGRGGDAARQVEPMVAPVRAEIAPETDLRSPSGRLIERVILRGLAELLDNQDALERGDLLPIPDSGMSDPSEPGSEPKIAAGGFLDHWQRFSDDKVSETSWTSETATHARASRNVFGQLIGNPSASDVTRATVSDFRSRLFALPRYYDKAKRWKGMALNDIIADAAAEDKRSAQKASPVLPRLTPATVNKHTGYLLEYWKWSATNGAMPKDAENPFTGFIKGKKKGRNARGERDVWPEEKLEALFASPIWSGCKSEHRRRDPGPHIFRDAMFGVPILGRALGAREDEICSALVGDIKFIGGFPCLSVSASKTEGSTRDIPLPKAVLDTGFLEYRYYGRAEHEPLFPELLPQGAANSRGAAFSGRFTDYRKSIGLFRPKMDFHSIRHNLATDLDNLAGLNPGWADEITGHVSKVRESERSRYSKGVFIGHLRETMDRLHLAQAWAHVRYEGPFGEPAPGAARERERFVKLAEREMAKGERRRRSTRKSLLPTR